jgi:hypothetical protein
MRWKWTVMNHLDFDIYDLTDADTMEPPAARVRSNLGPGILREKLLQKGKKLLARSSVGSASESFCCSPIYGNRSGGTNCLVA